MPTHTRKLLIGISPRLLRNLPPEIGFRGKTLQYLEQSVAHWVMGLGAMVVMIPTVERESTIRRADIDPTVYGEPRTEALGVTDPVRDRFELELLRAFAAADKPILGICRGHQLINVAFGGTLYQDLIVAGATSEPHVTPAYDEHVHALSFERDGWLAALYPNVEAPRVNSIHHQAIKQLGTGLRVEARGHDGVIEAVRKTDAGFIVGVQWHPEFHDARFPELLVPDPMLQAFLEAAAARRDRGSEPIVREQVAVA